MIIINEVTIFVEIPLKRDALARDENEDLIHDDDGHIERSFNRLDEIIMNNEVYGYLTEDEPENCLYLFVNGHLQDVTVKETIEIAKSFAPISRKPFIIETFIEGEYKYHVMFDEHTSTMEDAKVLDDLIQLKDGALPHIYKLADYQTKFGPDLKKLTTAVEKFFDQVEVKKILPTTDIMEAIDLMQQEMHNG